MLDAQMKTQLAAAIRERFQRQLDATAALVAVPSLRGAEGPALDLMADLMRGTGLAVDDWTVPVADLRSAPGWGPLEGADTVRSVVGTHRPEQGEGRSLILQGHVDVVPPGPLDMWARPPFQPVIEDGWMYGRGAADMKSGLVAGLFALDALRAVDAAPAGRVHLQAVVEEESTGLGALATLMRGYRADACFIPEPTGERLNRSQVGVLWFRLRVRGRPAHVAYAGEGSNAVMAAYHLIHALQALEAAWNERAADHPRFGAVEHPINFNPGIIRGGEWTSSVPAWCDVDCRIAVLPGWNLAACRDEIEAAVAAASAAHPFLAESPPVVEWCGFLAEGYTFEGAADVEAVLLGAHQAASGEPALGERFMTGLTDTRFYGLYHGIPAFCYGARGERIHAFDERVDLASLERLTLVIALFIAEWCGVTPPAGARVSC